MVHFILQEWKKIINLICVLSHQLMKYKHFCYHYQTDQEIWQSEIRTTHIMYLSMYHQVEMNANISSLQILFTLLILIMQLI